MTKQELYVVKVGGNVIDNKKSLRKFLLDFSKIKHNKLLIHGGGKVATDISKGLGVEARMIEGRRVTDEETLKIVTMVYGGLINKNIVSGLQSHGCNAIGLTGADANIIEADKRPIKKGIDYGFVGDVRKVNNGPLVNFFNAGLTPVIAPLTHNGNGDILNTNADTIASTLAVSLSQEYNVTLIYCFELKGVLKDFENKDSVISNISQEKFQTLKESGIISKGMIPKLDNSFEAINSGVEKVIICHSDDLLNIINKKEAKGTTLTK